MLAQIVDKEFFLLVYDCIVDSGSAKIDSGHDGHVVFPSTLRCVIGPA
jgi:hypothetical protein